MPRRAGAPMISPSPFTTRATPGCFTSPETVTRRPAPSGRGTSASHIQEAPGSRST